MGGAMPEVRMPQAGLYLLLQICGSRQKAWIRQGEPHERLLFMESSRRWLWEREESPGTCEGQDGGQGNGKASGSPAALPLWGDDPST